ncbi:glycosyltransferase family 4 protein [Pseudodesulfovibrio sp. zrk46]|uniref:glycosyltransferase family 4 protein n=1 Tax=Pseudodesulfovibrio sp. zrk46 TaxID=2725288 RepID=UPI001B383ED4|nr:glycosyltransferase family 4 protein [Pseudodesulfovibrio sp. zrk46]
MLIANWLAEHGHQVVLMTLSGDESPVAYELSSLIHFRRLGCRGNSSGITAAVSNNWLRIRTIRKALQEETPEVVLSFVEQTNVLVALAAVGLDIRCVVGERNDPVLYEIGRMWRLLRKIAYLLTDKVVVQAPYFIKSFSGAIRKKTVAIPNPVLPMVSDDGADRGHSIVAAGRLDAQKGFDLLLEAFQRVSSFEPEWTLKIFGEGHARGELEEMVESYGLQERVSLPGHTTELDKEMAQAGIFVLSSRFEGFPNVLAEAMASGVPVVATRCHGAELLIEEDRNGLLCPLDDAGALGDKLLQLMRDDALRTRLSGAARNVTSQFGLDSIMEEWLNVLSAKSGAVAG